MHLCSSCNRRTKNSVMMMMMMMISGGCFLHLLFQYFPLIVINWIQIWRQQLRWENLGVTFSDNSMVAHMQWGFQVSQHSAETLFRWRRNCLHDFAENLFRKWHTNFHQNLRSCIEDISEKNIFGLIFFWTHWLLVYMLLVLGCSQYFCWLLWDAVCLCVIVFGPSPLC